MAHSPQPQGSGKHRGDAGIPPGIAGDERIDLNDRADVDRWTRAFSVSTEELAKVIEVVGNRAGDVADYITQEGRPATSE